MKTKRQIIEIDEDKCNGCGACIIACAEGALEIIDGKARLVGEVYCDGLGACLGECPEDALHIVEREVEEFDEVAVEHRLQEIGRDTGEPHPAPATPEPETLACGCPGSLARSLATIEAAPGPSRQRQQSRLGHWPVKLQLLQPGTPFLRGADLYLVADCAGIAYPQLHQKILAGHAVAIGCPKLDDLEAHIERLAAILREARPRSLNVVHMEVPCCRGFVFAAEQAVKRSGYDLPLGRMKIGASGELLEDERRQQHQAAV